MRRYRYVIGLARYGCTNRPFYHIAAMRGRVIPKRPVDERVIEQIGSFDPLPNNHNEKMVAINYERVRYWLSQNAKVSHGVGELLGMHNVSLVFTRVQFFCSNFFSKSHQTVC